VKYEEVYLKTYDSIGEARTSIGGYLDSYDGRIRALTARRPIKPCFNPLPSAWELEPGRGST
jgi:putative transposase